MDPLDLPEVLDVCTNESKSDKVFLLLLILLFLLLDNYFCLQTAVVLSDTRRGCPSELIKAPLNLACLIQSI